MYFTQTLGANTTTCCHRLYSWKRKRRRYVRNVAEVECIIYVDAFVTSELWWWKPVSFFVCRTQVLTFAPRIFAWVALCNFIMIFAPVNYVHVHLIPICSIHHRVAPLYWFRAVAKLLVENGLWNGFKIFFVQIYIVIFPFWLYTAWHPVDWLLKCMCTAWRSSRLTVKVHVYCLTFQ